MALTGSDVVIPCGNVRISKTYIVIGVVALIFLSLIITIIVLATSAKSCDSCPSTGQNHDSGNNCDSCPTTGPNHDSGNNCDNADCYSYAAKLYDSLDFSVKPCDNFYKFACGKWISKSEMEDTLPMHSGLAEQQLVVTKRLKGILEGPTNPLITKPRIAYDACLKDNENKMFVTLKQQVKASSVGMPILTGPTWSTKHTISTFDDLLDKISQLKSEGLASESLFKVTAFKDLRNNSNTILMISQPDVLALPNLKFKVILAQVLPNLFDSSQDKSHQNKFIEDMIQIRQMIAALVAPVTDLMQIYTTTTIGEFSTAAKGVNWMEYFKKVVPKSIVLKPTDTLGVINMNFFKRFSDEVAKGSLNNFRSIIDLDIANTLISIVTPEIVSNSLKESYVSTFVKLPKRQFPSRSSTPSWLGCVDAVSKQYPSVLAVEYAKRYYEVDRDIKTVDELATGITETFREHLDELTWLDEKSRSMAKLKLNKMRRNYLYPSWAKEPESVEKFYNGLEVGQDHTLNAIKFRHFVNQKALNSLLPSADTSEEWPLSPLLPNAVYYQLTNSFYMFTGILQPPIFDADRLHAMNFGGIGTIVGHEITHAFDLTGTLFDAHGNIGSWLTATVQQGYNERSQCFIEQYNNYELTSDDLPFLQNGQTQKVDGKLTASENIADNGGLQQAFRAYQNWILKNGHERLPDILRNFTAEQVFFISFGQTWCTKYADMPILGPIIATDTHSPAKFRVIGSLANFKEFDNAFKCSAKTRNTCKLW